MKKVLTVIMIVVFVLIGYIVGYSNAIYGIVDVDKSAAGFQVYFEDGTGYWYEY